VGGRVLAAGSTGCACAASSGARLPSSLALALLALLGVLGARASSRRGGRS
jgi:MYXO-CTERM domain-containing protein